MSNASTTRPPRKWLDKYMVTSTIVQGLTLLGVIAVIILGLWAASALQDRPSDSPSEGISLVQEGEAFIRNAGFDEATYIGLTRGWEDPERKYPTFEATSVGGEPIKLWLRTTNGGWNIQPVGWPASFASADELARYAAQVVTIWENIPADSPEEPGYYGDYSDRKIAYEFFARYAPNDSYWGTNPDESEGWPRK